MNGSGERIPVPNANLPKLIIPRNYKLLVDPFITNKKEPKVYRYDGTTVNEQPTTVVVRDPRVRLTALTKRLEALDLPVARYLRATLAFGNVLELIFISF